MRWVKYFYLASCCLPLPSFQPVLKVTLCMGVYTYITSTLNTLDDCSILDNQGCEKCIDNNINNTQLDVSIIQYIVISRNICCTHFASLHSRVWYILSSVTGATLTRNVVTGNGQVVTCCQLVLTAVDITGITSLAQVSHHSLYDLMCVTCHHGRKGCMINIDRLQ